MLKKSKDFRPTLVVLFELTRYVCVGLGFFLAYQAHRTNIEILNYLLLWIVIPLAGLTGLESIFLGAASATDKGREIGSVYQIQSGLNNLSTAIIGFLVWYLQWGTQASLTVSFVLLLFLIFSSLNHAYEYWIQKNRQCIHFLRPLLTTALILACIPLVVRTLSH